MASNLLAQRVVATGGAALCSHQSEGLFELGARVVRVDDFLTGRHANCERLVRDRRWAGGGVR